MAPSPLSGYAELSETILSLPFYFTIPLILIIFGLAFIVKRRYFSSLCRFPGPFWASVTRWWLVHQIYRGDHEKIMLRLHRKYGPIIRISPFEVAISDPEAIKIIYGHTSNFTKSEWYLAWHNKNAGNPSLFSERDEKAHAIRRRNVANAYSMTTVVQLEEHVDSCSKQILKQFERLAPKGPIDLGEWLQMYGSSFVDID
jgi:cytochrome P450